MTTLKEAINAANASIAAPHPPSFLAELRSFETAAAKAAAPFESLNAKPPEGVNYKALVRKVRTRGIFPSNGEGGFTLRELRHLAWALWVRVDGSCVAENAPLLAQYLRTVAAQKKRSHFRALASSYLWNFAPDGPGVSAVAKTLRKLLEIAPPKWGERHRRWGVFADSGAARTIARHFMSAGTDGQAMGDAVKRVGLDGMLVKGGMSAAAFRDALRGYANAPNPGALRQLTAWRKFAAKNEGFCNSDYAEGLLLPWTGNAPPESVKSETLHALLDSHHDPRVHQVNWAGVKDEAKNVMFRWLVGVSIEQFFRVIDKIGGSEGRRMWPKRRKFWLAYHKRNYVTDAWVAFDRAGLNYLRGSRDVAYAALNGALHNHAVLLMRIGDLTIADWNQNGKCRIWGRNNKHAPQFYRRSYSAGTLRRASTFDRMHDSSGHWRYIVAEYIRDRTGIAVPAPEYM